MFTQAELDGIDRKYFEVLKENPHAVTLRSRNTKHEWHLLDTTGTGWRSCRIFHRHHNFDPWHEHSPRPFIDIAIEGIYSHDVYWLNKEADRKQKAKQRRQAYLRTHLANGETD